MPRDSAMIAVRSFAKINLGLYIGARRPDGFHELRTVYQTIALHDVVRVTVQTRGAQEAAITVTCDDPRVPLDSSNTCHQIAERVMEATGARGHVHIAIEKKLPMQGGLGAASSNGVATMLALEKVLQTRRSLGSKRRGRGKPRRHEEWLPGPDRLRIASDVGSDLPLFLIGGTVLGVGRGEQVYPLPDLPSIPIVVITPDVGVSTPQAFADWDALVAPKLTRSGSSDRLMEVGRALSAWLGGPPEAGAPAKGGGRAGSLLSDLVRAGIRNDFEQVVFSQSPELRDMKRALERAGSRYTSLSGSGSTLYGLFASPAEAATAGGRLQKRGLQAIATRTMTRREYRKSRWSPVDFD
jgi:4-diphosphocytidyl-2-C-methyl-D-erythritol kinase